jgi:DNA-binding transcriptional ArsR family regulator
MIMKKEKQFPRTGQKESMNNNPGQIEEHFGRIAALIGEKSRAIMLWNLLDGRAYTATELAIGANVSFQSASNHLSQLVNARLLITEKQGRHKYYHFANDRVAQAIENIAGLMPASLFSKSKDPVDLPGIKYARTCYDHLAGKIGVQLTQSLLQHKFLIAYTGRYEVSDAGNKWFESLDIDMTAIQKLNRKFAYPCLDWSERNHHLGGALGAALLRSMMQKDWIRNVKHSREIVVTGKGKMEMSKRLKLSL